MNLAKSAAVRLSAAVVIILTVGLLAYANRG